MDACWRARSTRRVTDAALPRAAGLHRLHDGGGERGVLLLEANGLGVLVRVEGCQRR